MLKIAMAVAAAMLVMSPTPAAQDQKPGDAASAAANDTGRICRHVVAAERGARPYELCMTEAEWKAKEEADAKNANRLVCHYVEAIGTRFKSRKVCMSAAEWENQRQEDRQAIERIQRSVCVPGAGC